MVLPNFLIVGAAKAGTTSFFEYLAQHPDVYVPFCKEPHYFSDAPHPALVKNDLEYAELFVEGKDKKAIGEASVTYLADEEAAFRIKKLLPDVKIIIFLRNPVARAYSAWWQMYQLGYDDLDFKEALKAEEKRESSHEFRYSCPVHYTFYRYFKNGLYSSQIKRYIDLFGRDRVKIYIFEEAVKNLKETCRDLFLFLGIDSDFEVDFKIYNASQVARFKVLQKTLADPLPFFKKIYDSMPLTVKKTVYKFLKLLYWTNTKTVKRPAMDTALRQELLKKYLSDIRELEKILNCNLGLWYKDIDKN